MRHLGAATGSLAARPARWLLSAMVLAIASTQALALPRVVPYVLVSVTPKELDLGTVPQPGVYDSPAALTVRVAANCAHGGLAASATPLTRAEGGAIGTDRIFIKLPAAGDYVPMTHPVVVTGPMMPGVFDVVLKFRVETILTDAPGEYVGTLVFTCAAGP